MNRFVKVFALAGATLLMNPVFASAYSKEGLYIGGDVEKYNEVKALEDQPKKQWPEEKTNVVLDHTWKIQFNQDLDGSTVTDENFFVYNSNEEVVEGTTVSLNDDKRTVLLKAPSEGYQPNQTYYLNISDGVKTTASKKLKQPVQMKFTTENGIDESEVLNQFFSAMEDLTRFTVTAEQNVEILSNNQSLFKQSIRANETQVRDGEQYNYSYNLSGLIEEMGAVIKSIEESVYLTSDELYLKSSSIANNSWNKLPRPTLESLNHPLVAEKIDISSQLDLMKQYKDFLKVSENESFYTISLSGEGELFIPVTKSILQTANGQAIGEISDNELKVIITLSKEDYLLESLNLSLKASGILPDIGLVDFKLDDSTFYSDHNTAKNIVVSNNIKQEAEGPQVTVVDDSTIDIYSNIPIFNIEPEGFSFSNGLKIHSATLNEDHTTITFKTTPIDPSQTYQLLFHENETGIVVNPN